MGRHDEDLSVTETETLKTSEPKSNPVSVRRTSETLLRVLSLVES